MPGLGAPKVPVTKKSSLGSTPTSSVTPESNPGTGSPSYGDAPPFTALPAPAPAQDYSQMAMNTQASTWQTQHQPQPPIQLQPAPGQRRNVEHHGHRRSGSFPTSTPTSGPSFPAHQHQQVAARGLHLPPLQPHYNGVSGPNGTSFNDYLRVQQGTSNMHQMPDMTVASGPGFEHGAMPPPLQDRYGPAPNYGNWSISPTNVSPTSSASATSQPLYGIPQQQAMQAQGQMHFNPTVPNGYDSTAYPVDGSGNAYYPHQQPAQQMVSQSGWPARNPGVPGSQGVLYEQDGTQVVYNDSVWNMFMSNLGMDMGG